MAHALVVHAEVHSFPNRSRTGTLSWGSLCSHLSPLEPYYFHIWRNFQKVNSTAWACYAMPCWSLSVLQLSCTQLPNFLCAFVLSLNCKASWQWQNAVPAWCIGSLASCHVVAHFSWPIALLSTIEWQVLSEGAAVHYTLCIEGHPAAVWSLHQVLFSVATGCIPGRAMEPRLQWRKLHNGRVFHALNLWLFWGVTLSPLNACISNKSGLLPLRHSCWA